MLESKDLAAVILGSLTLIGSSITGWLSYLAHKQAKEANDAVNHRVDKTQPRLYDLAVRNDARVDKLIKWKKAHVRQTREEFSKVENKLSSILDCFRNHVPAIPKPSHTGVEEEERG